MAILCISLIINPAFVFNWFFIYDKRDDFNLEIINFQICAAIYQLLLHMVFTSRNGFAMQGPVAIIPIS